MKYTLKYVLREKNKNGLHPIYLRITIARKKSDIATGHTIKLKYWDAVNENIRSTHELATEINADLLVRKQQALKKFVGLQMDDKIVSAKQLRNITVNKNQTTNIFEFVDKFKEDVRHKRNASTLENYRKHLLKLELFNKSKSLCFEDIDHEFLTRYENSLRDEKLSENYIHAIWKTLKTFFNEAKKRGLPISYPFTNYENPVYNAPDKDYLTIEEIKAWEEVTDKLTDPFYKKAAVYFLLGCYTGLRVSDWYLFDLDKNIVGDKIILRAKKNGGRVEMIISDPLRRNFERMKEWPLDIEEKTINKWLKKIAGKAEIKKHVTTHTGRHSFAVSVCLGNKLSSETAAELMGITLQTFVDNYSQVTQYKIDSETREAWKNL